VPTALDATDARVVAETERGSAAWRLDDAHVSALRRPKPRFELREVDIPERVTVGERVSVRVAVANVSGVAGVFRGVLNVANLQYAYAPYPFALDAAPGETVAWERTFDRTPPERADSIGFFLDTVAGNRETRAPVQHGTRGDTATAGTTTAASDASG
jgi:hypothetical protein